MLFCFDVDAGGAGRIGGIIWLGLMRLLETFMNYSWLIWVFGKIYTNDQNELNVKGLN